MSLGFPTLGPSEVPNELRRLLGADFPMFHWSDLLEKEDPIGRGTFGSVFVAKRGSPNGDKIVVKKLLRKDNYEQRLFMKEAKILKGIRNEHVVILKAACVDPCAIMLEYVYFDFSPFGGSEKVTSLDDFLRVIESRGVIQQFPFQYKAAEDTARGLAYLHQNGIVHRDIKPANILVSNQHYCSMTDTKVLQDEFKENPIICKLADFGESRSAVNQTAQLCRLATANLARGTPVYRAPELFRENSDGFTLGIQDLKAADVWALGMVFHAIVNPDLEYPFQMELQRVQQGQSLSELERLLMMKVKPSHSKKYGVFQVTDWYGVAQLFEQCTSFEPGDRPTAQGTVESLHKATAPSFLDIPLRVSQNSAIENAAAAVSSSNDGTNSCAFLSLAFSHLIHTNEDDSIRGEDEFQKMASLAEEVILTYPEKLNSYRDIGSQYDVSEAYEILRESHVIDADLEFNELLISPNAVFTSDGRRNFMAALRQIHDCAETKVGLYTCGGYIFTIGCKNGHYFVMDTHCIPKELGGNGKGLLNVRCLCIYSFTFVKKCTEPNVISNADCRDKRLTEIMALERLSFRR